MIAQHPDDLRDSAMYVWQSYLNVPYKWGGDDPLEGVDCSGLVLEGLKAVGLVPREADFSAAMLLNTVFHDLPRYHLESELKRGMLVFWGQPDGSVTHVEIVWATWPAQGVGGRLVVLTIGASGGGSRTVDRATAVKQNAYVKIRRITPGWLAAIDPLARWPSP